MWKNQIFFIAFFYYICYFEPKKLYFKSRIKKKFKLTAEKAYYLQNDEKIDFVVFCLFYRLLIGKRYLLECVLKYQKTLFLLVYNDIKIIKFTYRIYYKNKLNHIVEFEIPVESTCVHFPFLFLVKYICKVVDYSWRCKRQSYCTWRGNG